MIGALGLDDYDGLNVAEVTEKLDELSVEEHERQRGLEKRTEDLNNADRAWELLAPWDVHPGNARLERHAV